MKRRGISFGVIAVVLLLGLLTVARHDEADAQDSAIPALQTQVADLESRVSALEQARTSSPSAGHIASLRGTGPIQTTLPATLPNTFHFVFTCVAMDGRVDLGGPSLTPGATTLYFEAQTLAVDIRCTENWTLDVFQLA